MPKFNADAVATNELTFHPDPNKYGGMCLGTLEKVEVLETDASKNTGEGEYGGLAIPRLSFRFKQLKEDKGDFDRFFNYQERVINTLYKEGNRVEQDKIDGLFESMWLRLKHMLERLGAKPIPQSELNKYEIDEDAEPEVRIKQFKKFFEFIAKRFNEGGEEGTPLYKGKTLVLKLIAEYKERRYLTFPTYVGKGFIEVAKWKEVKGRKVLNTSLELAHNETIELGKPNAAPASSPDATDTDDLPDDVLNMVD